MTISIILLFTKFKTYVPLEFRPIDRFASTDLISVILKNKVDLNDVISIERDSP